MPSLVFGAVRAGRRGTTGRACPVRAQIRPSVRWMKSPGCFPVFGFPRDFAPAGAEKNLRPRVGGRRSVDNPSAGHSLSARNAWPAGTRVRSSGLRFVLLGPAFPSRFLGTVARSGPFVLAYSGGTAAAFHRLPIPGSIFSCPPHYTPVRRRVKVFSAGARRASDVRRCCPSGQFRLRSAVSFTSAPSGANIHCSPGRVSSTSSSPVILRTSPSG
jgi:hypothetical protein